LPFKVIYKQKPDPKKQYVFCANHFSFFDIPVMGINPVASLFVGKSSIARVPLFGYVYKKTHITLDRDKAKSRYEALERCKQEVDNGLSLAIFPEGGIVAKAPPKMGKFKDGAFKVAIEKQIPIVPVTIPFNWIILPDDTYLLCWHRNCIVFHEPIETTGMDMNDLEALKERTFRVIDKELEKYNKHEN
jgi:1-acyl-sn-glycerol-3-phosphate acyltransferase